MENLKQEIELLQARIKEYEQGIQADQILRSIAANSPSNIAFVDLESRILFINWTVPGITPEEMAGLKITDIVGEEFRPGITSAFERVANTGESDRYETSYISPSGHESWWESRVGPVIQDGKVTAFVVVSTDVTELRRKHEEQERFFNLSVDLMCVASFEGYFKRVNQAFTTTLGYENKELLNRPFLDFVHPEDQEETKQIMSRLHQGEVIRNSYNRYRAADGSYRYLSWRGVADQTREVIYAVARDVTETKSLEEQLQQSRRLEAIGQLAGGIAHDFNNLLGAIQGNIELAQISPKLSDSTLQNALEATNRAAALTKQLLVFSRHQALSPEVIDLVPLLDNLMDILKRLLPENISIILAHEKDVPCIFADKSQLEQVIINLCVNARDAMPDGGKLTLSLEKAHVPSNNEVTALPSGNYLRLTVKDTGTGMSADVKARIFEPFYTTKEIGKGSGLGLATVYAIVKQHKGFIEADSQLNHGSIFRVYLPITQQSPPNIQDTSEFNKTVSGGKETILLAEDDPMVRDTIMLILNTAGYSVLTANNGREAIQLFKTHGDEIALALLDVVMPELGGFEAADQLRVLCPSLKIIFTSGHVQNNQDPARLDKEIFLPKPCKRDALLATIRKSLDTPA